MNKTSKDLLKTAVNNLHVAVTADDKAEALHIIKDDIVPILSRKPGRQKGYKKDSESVNNTVDTSVVS